MGRKKSCGVDTEFAELRKLLIVAMAEGNLAWSDVLKRMDTQMTIQTVAQKVKKPETMRLNELFDIAKACGVSRKEVVGVL